MISASTDLINSPLVVTLLGIGAAGILSLVGATFRLVIQMAKFQTEIRSEMQAIRQDLSDIKTDPDIMRWSNYGRAVQAMKGTQ